MAPPAAAPALKAVKMEPLVEQRHSLPRGTTPSSVIAPKDETRTVKEDEDLATVFKSDLTNIRNLVTCSICDQLLYEPWTLGCGHTYCYSCLCSWFLPNKRKKSCPECRTRVKQIPAPNYLVKQMVEMFTKRGELMPSDESIDQHTQKRAEEIAEVDRDRNAAAGLFKGAFPANGGQSRLFRDEQDGVWRCPGCHHEHEGGPSCQNCGHEMDMEEDEIDYEFYSDIDNDVDLENLDELSLDMDAELDAEIDFRPQRYYPVYHNRHVHFRHPGRPIGYDGSESSEMESSEDEDDGGSLHEFVAPDDEEPTQIPVRRPNNQPNQREPITISDDESDEGGAVSNRFSRRRARVRISPSPSVITVTDNNTATDSEAGDMHSEAELLRDAGWSPLDQGNDSEAEEHLAFNDNRYGDGYGSSVFGQSDNNSDTETMVGNGGSDSDEDRSREEFSATPTYAGYAGPPYIPHEHMPENYESLDEDADDDDSEAGFSSVYDRDGDTEMSASPRASRSASVNTDGYGYGEEMSASPMTSRSVSVNTDGYNNQADYPEELGSESSVSRSTPDDEPRHYGFGFENFGDANQIHNIEDDSEDDSPRPPHRRQQNRPSQEVQVQQQYNPRISRMFADHQQSLRAEQPGRMITLGGWGEDTGRNDARNRRMTAYRHQPSRRVDPLRSSRSPSANRVIASSSRNSRPPRQYNFARGHN